MGMNKNRLQSQLHKLTVLIADDDSPTRLLLRAAISKWGYSVIEATDGEDAWNILQKSDKINLVILDWIMPKLDGLDVCQKIVKELSYHPYIILLTQVTGSENIIKGLDAGADEFLSKPFNMAELRSRLSVGARIVNYQIQLEKNSRQFQEYTSNLEFIATIAAAISEKINELNSLLAIANESVEIKINLLKIEELKKSINQLLGVIDRFQRQNKNYKIDHD
jgi:DNA-binding response OmpR family regulator